MTHNDFLKAFQQQNEPALLVSDTVSAEDIKDFREISGDIDHLTSELKKGGNIVITIAHPLPHNLYGFIKQYTERNGDITLPFSGELQQIQIDTNNTRILLIATYNDLTDIEKEYPIREAVGMVFEDN